MVEYRKISLTLGRHIPALDGIRGLAILPVLFYHFTIGLKNEPTLSIVDTVFIRVCGAGWLGVDLFFVLSGFLITGILYDTRESTTYFTSFYARRFLRIFPLYYGLLIFSFFIAPAFLPLHPARLNALLANKWWFLSYTINWKIAWLGVFSAIPAGYIWSLAVEEQFYVIWPCIVLAARDRIIPVAKWLLVGSVLLRTCALALGATPTSVYVATLTHMDGLLLGAILAVHLRVCEITQRHYHIARIVTLATGALLLLLFIKQGEFYFYTRSVAYVGFLGLSVCFGGLLSWALLAPAGSSISIITNNKFLRSFGKYSYCLYLIHHPVGTFLERSFFNPRSHRIFGSCLASIVFFIILATAVCWVLGFASWHMYEKQFLKLKKRFNYGGAARVQHSCIKSTPPVLCE